VFQERKRRSWQSLADIIRIFMRRSARKEGRVQSNQLHALQSDTRNGKAGHNDQSCAWEVRHEEAEDHAKQERKGGNRRRYLRVEG
jgi:hypothetical protein